MSELTATVAPLFLPAFTRRRNFVWHDVVIVAKVVYATIVAALIAANLAP